MVSQEKLYHDQPLAMLSRPNVPMWSNAGAKLITPSRRKAAESWMGKRCGDRCTKLSCSLTSTAGDLSQHLSCVTACEADEECLEVNRQDREQEDPLKVQPSSSGRTGLCSKRFSSHLSSAITCSVYVLWYTRRQSARNGVSVLCTTCHCKSLLVERRLVWHSDGEREAAPTSLEHS